MSGRRGADLSSADPLRGQLVGDKYRAISLLGRGGMGRVYLAEDRVLGRQVALKLLREDFVGDEEHVKRFVREARAAAAIGHRNIVHVYEIGETAAGSPFMAMEALAGRDLRRELAEAAPLSLARAVDIAGQMLFALAAAHRAGVVHRDLKPSNVFLTPVEVSSFADLDASAAGGGGPVVVKILDFGVSRFLRPAAAGSDLTATGAVVGTFRYMAPEQLDDARAVDGRADLFAVGVILYECLTGESPFGGDDAQAIMRRALKPRIPDVLQARPDLPAAFGAVLGRSLAADPAERFQSAEELIAALRPFHGADVPDAWAGSRSAERRGSVHEAPTAAPAVAAGIVLPDAEETGTDAPTTVRAPRLGEGPGEDGSRSDGPRPAGTSVGAPSRPSRRRVAALVVVGLLSVAALGVAVAAISLERPRARDDVEQPRGGSGGGGPTAGGAARRQAGAPPLTLLRSSDGGDAPAPVADSPEPSGEQADVVDARECLRLREADCCARALLAGGQGRALRRALRACSRGEQGGAARGGDAGRGEGSGPARAGGAEPVRPGGTEPARPAAADLPLEREAPW